MKSMLRLLSLTVILPAMGFFPPFTFAQDSGATGSTEVRATLDELLPKIHSSSSFGRSDALGALMHRLDRVQHDHNLAPVGADQRRLAQELIGVYSEIAGSGAHDEDSKRLIVLVLTKFGDREIAKPFILRILDTCSMPERFDILNTLGLEHGLGGPDFYAKIESLVQKGVISPEWRTNFLVKVDKQRALAEMIKDIKTTTDRKIFMHAAANLQDYFRQPDDYRLTLRRAKEFGLLKTDFLGPYGLFWINYNLLAEYLKIAKGEDLHLCLEVMGTSPALVAPAAIPVLIEKLSDPDPVTRRLAIHPLHMGSYHGRVNQGPVLEAIRAALSKEPDPNIRAEMQQAVDETEYVKQLKEAREKNSLHKP